MISNSTAVSDWLECSCSVVCMSVPGKTKMGVDGGISIEGIFNSVGRVTAIVNGIGAAVEVIHPKYFGMVV